MSERLRVGLLFGGRSVEHEVSVVSARGVARAMVGTRLDCVPLGVTGEGRWLSPELSGRLLAGDSPRVEPSGEDDGVRLLVDPGAGGLLAHARGRPPEPIALDVLFPLIHGWGGEDGRLQGVADLAGLPCVGAGLLGSAAGMDKAVAKRLFEAEGLAVVPWRLLTREDWERDARRALERIEDGLAYPLFVKPANGGSSVGIRKVAERGALAPAVEHALEHDRRVVVEQGIDAREIECAVLGNEDPRPSGLGEIVPSREFYDYEAKYLDGTSALKIPADVAPALAATMREQALAAFRALDLAGLARVDFLLDRTSGVPYLNEVNTLPGFTPISMFPKLWEAAGLSYPGLVERLVALALERGRLGAARASRRKER